MTKLSRQKKCIWIADCGNSAFCYELSLVIMTLLEFQQAQPLNNNILGRVNYCYNFPYYHIYDFIYCILDVITPISMFPFKSESTQTRRDITKAFIRDHDCLPVCGKTEQRKQKSISLLDTFMLRRCVRVEDNRCQKSYRFWTFRWNHKWSSLRTSLSIHLTLLAR